MFLSQGAGSLGFLCLGGGLGLCVGVPMEKGLEEQEKKKERGYQKKTCRASGLCDGKGWGLEAAGGKN